MSISVHAQNNNYNAGTNSSAGMGSDNTVIGVDAGNDLSTGSANNFFGRSAGFENTGGGANNFFGRSAGFFNTNGGRNCFFGEQAGGRNTTGTNNSFFGAESGLWTSSGRDNLFIGERAGFNNTSGSRIIAIGRGAGPTATNMALSDRLYIDIALTSEESIAGNDNPLIYGEFDNDFVRINGTFEVTAGLTNPSSRTLKNQFVTLDASTILAKLSELDIQQWTYKTRPDEKHVGPVAEDFYEAFGLGQGDKNISTIDADGIMMLAIQGLNNKLIEENRELREGNDELKNEVEEMRRMNAIIIGRLETLENQ